jgi:hypothetical protein
MVRWFALILLLSAFGCELPAPPDFTGTWQTVDSSDYPVKLVFRKDGSYYRSRVFGGYEWRTAGAYKVEARYIEFRPKFEGFMGRDESEVDAVLKAPYETRGAQLVLFPGTVNEERFAQVE